LRDGLTLLRAIHEQGYHLEEVGLPCYPEGHPAIPENVLREALRAKEPFAHSMTTQMSFNAGAIAAWIDAIRQEGIALPIHLGLPGVVQLAKLIKIAGRIGVADATRYLLKNRGLVGLVLQGRSFQPETILLELVSQLTARADVRVLHLFTMNDVVTTVAWQRRMLEELT
jgi:methylenetetrahydrofolate reductase (NADPH)